MRSKKLVLLLLKNYGGTTNMKDKLYCWLYNKAIRKYNKQTIQNLYFSTRKAYLSGKYTGVALHKLKLQLKVLKDKVGTNV